MYIAVVSKGVNKQGELYSSGRSNNSWASFVSTSRSQAIRQALEANERWGGGYTVLVGKLTKVARPVRNYYLSEL